MSLDEKSKIEIKLIVLEALKEYDKNKYKRINNEDNDLITTSQAYKLRGKYRVNKLIMKGHLKRMSDGDNYNSTKYISKKALLELDKLNLKSI